MAVTGFEGKYPPCLRKRDQWIHWLDEDGNKVPKKVGIGNVNASSTDPDTWTCYYDASTSFKPEKRTGLGFVLTENDPFICLDLDKVRIPSEGTIIPWALRLIKDMDSLTYISPSGSGFHIWIRSDTLLEKLSVKHPKAPETALEIFSYKRYMTMSGDFYLKKPIQDRTKKITSLHSKLKAAVDRKNAADNPPQAETKMGFGSKEMSLPEWLMWKGIPFKEANSPKRGTVYQLYNCPWASGHTKGKDSLGNAAVFLDSTGRWCFKCCHNHCLNYGWKEFRAEVSPKVPFEEFTQTFGKRRNYNAREKK